MHKEFTYHMLAPQLQFIYINVFHTILCFLIRDCKLLEFKKIIRRLIRKSAMLAFVTPRNIFFFFTSTWNVIGLNCEYFFCCFVFQFIFNNTHTYLNNSSKNKRLLLKIAVSCSLSISQNICVLLLLNYLLQIDSIIYYLPFMVVESLYFLHTYIIPTLLFLPSHFSLESFI